MQKYEQAKTPKIRAKIARHLLAGKNYSQIAKLIGAKEHSAVIYHVKKMGIRTSHKKEDTLKWLDKYRPDEVKKKPSLGIAVMNQMSIENFRRKTGADEINQGKSYKDYLKEERKKTSPKYKFLYRLPKSCV